MELQSKMSEDLKGQPLDGECAKLLQEHFVSDFRYGYKKYRGVVLSERYQTFADKIENLEVRDDDIWVMSYPKTGMYLVFPHAIRKTARKIRGIVSLQLICIMSKSR